MPQHFLIDTLNIRKELDASGAISNFIYLLLVLLLLKLAPYIFHFKTTCGKAGNIFCYHNMQTTFSLLVCYITISSLLLVLGSQLLHYQFNNMIIYKAFSCTFINFDNIVIYHLVIKTVPVYAENICIQQELIINSKNWYTQLSLHHLRGGAFYPDPVSKTGDIKGFLSSRITSNGCTKFLCKLHKNCMMDSRTK